jgi:cytochrome c oxidase assembly protein subunit 15
MGGRIIPQDIDDPNLKPKWRNIFENSSLVQFEHRFLAIATLVGSGAFWLVSRRFNALGLLTPAANKASHLVLGTSMAQVSLGIATLLSYVPFPLAMTHQAGSLALLSSGVYLMHCLRGPPARLLVSLATKGK